MNPQFPFFRSPFYYSYGNSYIRNPYLNNNFNSNNIKENKNSTGNNLDSSMYSNTYKTVEDSNSSDDIIEILGLKLHFDDVLIICLIFFLYKQEVHDTFLFIALILLLMS